MGAAASSDLPTFAALYAALPEAARARLARLAERDDPTLLTPHAAAPHPLPSAPVGVTMRLRHAEAREALRTVPRLQRKHYELIPRALAEADFFVNFFTHATVIVREEAPELLPPTEPEMWKGEDLSANSFEKMWQELSEEKKAAIAQLAARDSDVLLKPNPASPPPFPPLPIGFEVFIDQGSAVSALQLVPGLQNKLYVTTSGSGPGKLAEKDFWVNFLTHATVIACG